MPQAAATPKPLQIFKPGRHTAMSGQQVAFSESDLQATVAAYDPAKHEAPLVVGHPKADAPAYGWVQALAFADGGIDATAHQVNADFAELVQAGAFKKISASFYSPDAPTNPVPGVYYLRHVGFLGAQPPAVKGLRSPSFAELEEGVVEFSEWDDAVLLRDLRESILGRFANVDSDPENPPAFSEPQPRQEFTVTEEEAARLRAQAAADAARIAELEAAAVATRRAATHAAHLAFCDGLPGMLPAWRDVAVATLDHLAEQPAVVEFGEGDARAPLIDGFKTMLAALPAAVEFGETATAARAAAAQSATVEFAAPAGYTVDATQLAVHQKALAHQAAHGGTYKDAVNAVS